MKIATSLVALFFFSGKTLVALLPEQSSGDQTKAHGRIGSIKTLIRKP